MSSVLILSSSALTDRMLAHTDALRILREEAAVRIWATSAANPRFRPFWQSVAASVEPFPEIRPYPTVPINALRRLNDYSWDFAIRDPGRMSAMERIRKGNERWWARMWKNPARAVASLGLQEGLEQGLERMMTAYDRSPEALARLQADPPAAVLAMGPMRHEEPAVVAAAKKLKIPVFAFITSWDNISIKSRMVFRYDGYFVWSEQMKRELMERYSASRRTPISIVGAPQFDAFFRTSNHLSRQEFCRRYGLNPARPIIVHALGVANGVEEHWGALDLARRVAAGDLGDAQLMVRPHPFLNHLELREMFRAFAPRVVVQQSGDPSEERIFRSQDHESLIEWVNTFRHADVVVHLSSTVAIDAALFDRPSVCMDYDPAPGSPRQELVREVNHSWTHYKPVAESGGQALAASPEELVQAIRKYLENPGLHQEARRGMAEYVCGYIDGRCGARLGEAVLQLMKKKTQNAQVEVTCR
jgi:CDP-Glycerol:Poly(glycerophosphate) glycerophosphotransferase